MAVAPTASETTANPSCDINNAYVSVSRYHDDILTSPVLLPTTSQLYMPVEIWGCILENVDDPHTLWITCRQVSKTFGSEAERAFRHIFVPLFRMATPKNVGEIAHFHGSIDSQSVSSASSEVCFDVYCHRYHSYEGYPEARRPLVAHWNMGRPALWSWGPSPVLDIWLECSKYKYKFRKACWALDFHPDPQEKVIPDSKTPVGRLSFDWTVLATALLANGAHIRVKRKTKKTEKATS
jgi:hypothetical protein